VGSGGVRCTLGGQMWTREGEGGGGEGRGLRERARRGECREGRGVRRG